jgi:hypothetical protein
MLAFLLSRSFIANSATLRAIRGKRYQCIAGFAS